MGWLMAGLRECRSSSCVFIRPLLASGLAPQRACREPRGPRAIDRVQATRYQHLAGLAGGRPWSSSSPRTSAAVREMARPSRSRRWHRMRRPGTRTGLPGRDAAQGGRARLRGDLCPRGCRRLGADAARRGDPVRGAGRGLHLDRGLPLDPQHGRLDDRHLRRRGAAQRWLPDLCAMRLLASYCLTEPGLGLDAASLAHHRAGRGQQRLRARRQQGVHLGRRGQRPLPRHVPHRRRGAGGRQLGRGREGHARPGFGKPEKKLGWHSQPTAVVTFDGCRVPVANRIGAEGDGFKIAMRGLDGGRVNIAACSLGAARACLERRHAYLQGAAPVRPRIADFQALQFRLADMATELEAARLMVWRAAASLDAVRPTPPLHCAMAKRFATDVGFKVVNEALQLHGGYGYIQDYGIERYLRDCAGAPDPRGHQRDHAGDHRPPAAGRLLAGMSDDGHPLRAAGPARRRGPRPAAGAERADPRGWCGR